MSVDQKSAVTILARDLTKDGAITLEHVKNLYKMQQDSTVKPVRFLTGKHIFPSNLGKMNVERAIQLLQASEGAGGAYLRCKFFGS